MFLIGFLFNILFIRLLDLFLFLPLTFLIIYSRSSLLWLVGFSKLCADFFFWLAIWFLFNLCNFVQFFQKWMLFLSWNTILTWHGVTLHDMTCLTWYSLLLCLLSLTHLSHFSLLKIVFLFYLELISFLVILGCCLQLNFTFLSGLFWTVGFLSYKRFFFLFGLYVIFAFS